MAPESNAFDPDGGSLDHFHLEDGTLMIFDPECTSAWVECDSPIALAEQT